MSSTNYERDDRRRRSHSKSRSKSRRYHDDDHDDYHRRSYSRSRSRSRSLERRKRRHRGNSRSRSRDKESRRYRSSRRYSRSASRSRSRSRGHSHRSHKRHTYSRSRSRSSHRSQQRSSHYRSESRSPKMSTKHDDQHSSRSSSIDHNKKRQLSVDTDSRRSRTEDTLTNHGIEQESSSTQYFSSNTCPDNLENLPLPEQTENSSNANEYEYYAEPDEPIDKERIHREMEEKLRAALAKEGKVYPPPKPEASHPVFANDGSFLEIFKKMQEAQNSVTTAVSTTTGMTAATLPMAASTSMAATTSTSFISKPTGPVPPLVGRRRGGKILKTGLVAKSKVTSGGNEDKDFWSLYLAEVNKYKNHACESDSGKRPLLK